MRVLVTWASCHGSTAAIARRITVVREDAGSTVELRPVAGVEDVPACDAVVVGTSATTATGRRSRPGPGRSPGS